MPWQDLIDRESVSQITGTTQAKSLVATGRQKVSPSRRLIASREWYVVSVREDITFPSKRRNYLFENTRP